MNSTFYEFIKDYILKFCKSRRILLVKQGDYETD
jgi:hypothetical protein